MIRTVSFIAAILVCQIAVCDTLVVVTMQLCEPCRALKRALKERPGLYAGHTLVIAEGREPMKRWGVTSVPTMIRVAADGHEVGRHTGYSSDSDIQRLLK